MARIFFFTSLSAFRSNARTRRILAAKETPTIMEFTRAFNEEPRADGGKAGIVAGAGLAPHNGGRQLPPQPEEYFLAVKKPFQAENITKLTQNTGWGVAVRDQQREFSCHRI